MKTFMRMFTKMQTLFAPMAFSLFPLMAAAVTCGTQSGADQTLCNPTIFSNVGALIAGFLRAVVIIVLPILALFIVYSGFLFVMARGNPGQLTKARENFLYVILGGALILGAWTLATMIGTTVTQVVGS